MPELLAGSPVSRVKADSDAAIPSNVSTIPKLPSACLGLMVFNFYHTSRPTNTRQQDLNQKFLPNSGILQLLLSSPPQALVPLRLKHPWHPRLLPLPGSQRRAPPTHLARRKEDLRSLSPMATSKPYRRSDRVLRLRLLQSEFQTLIILLVGVIF